MKLVLILGSVAVGLWLLSLIRIGVCLALDESGFRVRVKAGAWSIQVYPRKPARRKRKKQHTAPEAPSAQPSAPQEPKPKKRDTIALVKTVLPLFVRAAGKLKQKIRLDQFDLDLIWGMTDPAACALGFGAANAAAGMIWPLVEQNFHVAEHRIRTAVDFDRAKPALSLETQATLRLGQALVFGFWLGIQCLNLLRRAKPGEQKTIQQKEAV